jgi:hypothetical protein
LTLFPEFLDHRLCVWTKGFVIAVLKVLLNFFTEPTSLSIVWWLGSADEYGFDMIKDIAGLNKRLGGPKGQPAVFSDPPDAEPRKTRPPISERIFLMVLETAKQILVSSASLTDIDKTEIVIVEHIDASLVPEICGRRRRFFRRNTL